MFSSNGTNSGAFTVTTGTNFIGKGSCCSNYNGSIDDLKIFNRALTDGEVYKIKDIYT